MTVPTCQHGQLAIHPVDLTQDLGLFPVFCSDSSYWSCLYTTAKIILSRLLFLSGLIPLFYSCFNFTDHTIAFKSPALVFHPLNYALQILCFSL